MLAVDVGTTLGGGGSGAIMDWGKVDRVELSFAGGGGGGRAAIVGVTLEKAALRST